MSGDHKKTHNKADPDEENLSDSLLGVLRSSRGNRNMEVQRLEKMLQEMMDEKVKQLVAETNIPQLIQQHALKGQNSFQVDIESYCVQWQLAVSTEVYNITLTRSWMNFLHTLHKTLNNEELTTQIIATCARNMYGQPCGRDMYLGGVGNLRSDWRCGTGHYKAVPKRQRLHISWT